MIEMIPAGVWEATKGATDFRACSLGFASVMLVGCDLGLPHVPLSFVEPSRTFLQ